MFRYDRFSGRRADRINQRLLRLKRLFVHLVLTVVLALSLTYTSNPAIQSASDTLIPVIVLLFIAHAFKVMYREAEHFIVQQEMAAQDAELEEKPKRGGRLVLDDDGELVEIFSDDEPEEKPKRAE